MSLLVYGMVILLLGVGIFCCLIRVPEGRSHMPSFEDEKVRRFGVRIGSTLNRKIDKELLADILDATAKAYKKTVGKAHRIRAGLLRPRRTERINKEIYTALGIMRNLASADAGGRVTTDALLEMFAKTEGLLQSTFSGVLRLMRLNKRPEAIEYFASAAGTDFSRDFIIIIIEWDNIEPAKLQKAILSFRSAMKEIRTTELIKKDEVLSDIVFLPVIVGILIIFVNFIYISYFIEQKELLTELFF